MKWFSAMLVFVIHIEGIGAERFARSLIVFQSEDDFEKAAKIALEEGLLMEQKYENGDGNVVRWKLKEVETLDLLGANIGDKQEIYSEFQEIPESGRAIDLSELRPELHTPTQTGV